MQHPLRRLLHQVIFRSFDFIFFPTTISPRIITGYTIKVALSPAREQMHELLNKSVGGAYSCLFNLFGGKATATVLGLYPPAKSASDAPANNSTTRWLQKKGVLVQWVDIFLATSKTNNAVIDQAKMLDIVEDGPPDLIDDIANRLIIALKQQERWIARPLLVIAGEHSHAMWRNLTTGENATFTLVDWIERTSDAELGVWQIKDGGKVLVLTGADHFSYHLMSGGAPVSVQRFNTFTTQIKVVSRMNSTARGSGDIDVVRAAYNESLSTNAAEEFERREKRIEFADSLYASSDLGRTFGYVTGSGWFPQQHASLGQLPYQEKHVWEALNWVIESFGARAFTLFTCSSFVRRVCDDEMGPIYRGQVQYFVGRMGQAHYETALKLLAISGFAKRLADPGFIEQVLELRDELKVDFSSVVSHNSFLCRLEDPVFLDRFWALKPLLGDDFSSVVSHDSFLCRLEDPVFLDRFWALKPLLGDDFSSVVSHDSFLSRLCTPLPAAVVELCAALSYVKVQRSYLFTLLRRQHSSNDLDVGSSVDAVDALRFKTFVMLSIFERDYFGCWPKGLHLRAFHQFMVPITAVGNFAVGVHVRDVFDDITGRGKVVVDLVHHGTPACTAGVPVGSTILQINGGHKGNRWIRIQSTAELKNALQAAATAFAFGGSTNCVVSYQCPE